MVSPIRLMKDGGPGQDQESHGVINQSLKLVALVATPFNLGENNKEINLNDYLSQDTLVGQVSRSSVIPSCGYGKKSQRHDDSQLPISQRIQNFFHIGPSMEKLEAVLRGKGWWQRFINDDRMMNWICSKTEFFRNPEVRSETNELIRGLLEEDEDHLSGVAGFLRAMKRYNQLEEPWLGQGMDLGHLAVQSLLKTLKRKNILNPTKKLSKDEHRMSESAIILASSIVENDPDNLSYTKGETFDKLTKNIRILMKSPMKGKLVYLHGEINKRCDSIDNGGFYPWKTEDGI